MKPAKMLVVGGVYLVRGEQHVLTSANQKDVSCGLKHVVTGKETLAGCGELEGPSHVPCPYCGRIQVLKSNFGQIELSEHLERCRFVTENQPEVVTE